MCSLEFSTVQGLQNYKPRKHIYTGISYQIIENSMKIYSCLGICSLDSSETCSHTEFHIIVFTENFGNMYLTQMTLSLNILSPVHV